MKSVRTICLAAIFMGVSFWGLALAGESGNRKELKRVDLSGAPGVEVIASISEYKPGEYIGRHFHHGVESGYVLQGAMIQLPGKEPVLFPAGTLIMNEREEAHAGFTVVGDVSLKLYTVHIVDKGKPLYEWVDEK